MFYLCIENEIHAVFRMPSVDNDIKKSLFMKLDTKYNGLCCFTKMEQLKLIL